jgi:hypothetical protein
MGPIQSHLLWGWLFTEWIDDLSIKTQQRIDARLVRIGLSKIVSDTGNERAITPSFPVTPNLMLTASGACGEAVIARVLLLRKGGGQEI